MLTTLLRYEFKAVGRILLPLFGAWLIASALLGWSVGGDGSQSNLIITLTALLYAFVAIAAVVITTILLIQRFYKNLLGNEGYLMFALPVTAGQHLTNKTISAAVWGTVGTIVAILSGLIIAGCVEGFGSLFEGIHFFVADMRIIMDHTPSVVLFIPEFILLILVGFAGTATKVYASLAVGHQLNSHRILGSIAAYLVFGTAESILTIPLGLLFETDLADSFFSTLATNMTDLGFAHLVMWALVVLAGLLTAIYWFISWKLLDKRLNLE